MLSRYGKGKRTGVYGSYLLAIWDPENEEFQAITKIGTGFSEEALQALHMAAETCEKKRYFNTPEAIAPDVWFEPKHVWEVKAADLSISPGYKAGVGLVDATKGISIRFPRFIRIRDDKDVTDSTSPEQVRLFFVATDNLFTSGARRSGFFVATDKRRGGGGGGGGV